MIHWACCFLQYFYQKENIYDFNRIGQKGFCRGPFCQICLPEYPGNARIICLCAGRYFFISLAQGADGITALNLILPLYSLIFAIGSMIGVGSATRFKIYRARGDQEADYYFSNAIIFAVIFGLIFSLAGLFFPGPIVRLLGGTEDIVAIGIPYTRIFMLFGPFFMMNYICNAFVRNDGNPSLAMTATFSSSIFNIVMDYVLMFPLKMGCPARLWPLPSLPSWESVSAVSIFFPKRTPSVSVCSFLRFDVSAGLPAGCSGFYG